MRRQYRTWLPVYILSKQLNAFADNIIILNRYVHIIGYVVAMWNIFLYTIHVHLYTVFFELYMSTYEHIIYEGRMG